MTARLLGPIQIILGGIAVVGNIVARARKVRILAYGLSLLAVHFLATIPVAASTIAPAVVLGWASGTDWGNPFPLGAPTYRLDARFRLVPPGGAWTNATGALDFKSQGANPSTITTSTVTVTAFPVTATGSASSTRTYISPFPFFRMNLIGCAILTAPTPATTPPTFIQAQYWASDPIGYFVGDVGTDLTITHSLLAGTSFLRTDLEPGQPNLNLYSRFGLGSGFSEGDPTTLWGSSSPIPAPPPPNAFDLFGISIEENASGTGVRAIVSPDPSSSLAGFDVIPSRTSSQIKSLIESANWTRSGDSWTLQSDLELYQLRLVNGDMSNEGRQLVIGNFFSNGATLSSVPEPSTLLLLGTGMIGLLGYGWLRRAGAHERKTSVSDPIST
jgi:hypothetical protein